MVYIWINTLLSFLQKEFRGLYLFFKENRNEAVVISTASLFLVLNYYHPLWNVWFSTLFYCAILPIIVIVVVLRRNPLDFGFRLGKPRIWGIYVIIMGLVVFPILWVTSHSLSFQSYYKMEQFNLINYFLVTCVNLLASEFLFRGFLLFGLKEKLKEGSIFIQMIPFVLVHLGKPELETVSTLITGIYFGYAAYRGNSCWPAFIMHLFINVYFVTAINL